jgi:predicted MPP superfamily phosphohydrolase
MNKIITVSIVILVLFGIDYYVFQAVRVVFQEKNAKTTIYGTYWTISAFVLLAVVAYNFVRPDILGNNLRRIIMVTVFAIYISKFFSVIFIFLDDFSRLVQWFFGKITDSPKLTKEGISRSDFMMKLALGISAAPMLGMAYGIFSGAHDYRIKKHTVKLPNLPPNFDGLKIVQISDVHAGSFFDKEAVKRGIAMLLDQNPDIVFFTGDLVNNIATEMEEYIEVFGKITAPLGVFSTLGNHDYGDYVYWENEEAKVANLEKLKQIHAQMGWRLLMNENQMIDRNGEKIAIIGVENWSAKPQFPKKGKLKDAYAGTQEAAVKLLLSHDPTHWDAEIRPKYADIDITFSGHTHGAQFGLEIGDIRWSPVKYVYKQWAGLHQEANQYLYVNRGFGYLGFPGRIGIFPEITVIELRKG